MEFRFVYERPFVVDNCSPHRIACQSVEWRREESLILSVEDARAAIEAAEQVTDNNVFKTGDGEVLKRRPIEVIQVVKKW